MAWNKIAKPNSSNWNIISNDQSRGNSGEFGFGEFGVANFGQGSNTAPDNWKKVTKPSTRNWNKVAKPTS